MIARDPLLEATKRVNVGGAPAVDDVQSLKVAIASELGKHTAGMGSRPGMLGPSGRDDAGLRCSCKGWALPGDERGMRPWSAFHRHVADVIMATYGDRLHAALTP